MANATWVGRGLKMAFERYQRCIDIRLLLCLRIATMSKKVYKTCLAMLQHLEFRLLVIDEFQVHFRTIGWNLGRGALSSAESCASGGTMVSSCTSKAILFRKLTHCIWLVVVIRIEKASTYWASMPPVTPNFKP